MFTANINSLFTGERGYKINKVQFVPTTLCKKPALLAAGHTHTSLSAVLDAANTCPPQAWRHATINNKTLRLNQKPSCEEDLSVLPGLASP